MIDFLPKEQLIERVSWLIRLRWIAVGGVILVITFSHQVLKFSLPLFPLYNLTIFLAIYNFIFFLLMPKLKKTEHLIVINRITNLQILLDLLSLALLIHFSGGIENPFLFYFIFHMIIASILLSRRAAFLQATFGVFLFSLTVMGEYFGFFSHYCLKGFIPFTLHNHPLYIIGIGSVFISTLYIAVYMATSISSQLREREKSLKEANALLLEKDRIKSEYVLTVTHHIKDDLSTIDNCIQPLISGIVGGLNERQLDLLKRASERTNKLIFFIKALLEITRLKLIKEIKRDYFSFKEVVSEAINYISPKAKDKNIAISYNLSPTIDKIKGTKEYIQEMLIVLLANSVKYTPSGGRITLEVSDKGDALLIQIKDTGIGIPKDELPKIFEEFYRASNAKEVEKDGTGLGLSIAKQIVERHQGKIWAESEEGKGSTFNIILPK